MPRAKNLTSPGANSTKKARQQRERRLCATEDIIWPKAHPCTAASRPDTRGEPAGGPIPGGQPKFSKQCLVVRYNNMSNSSCPPLGSSATSYNHFAAPENTSWLQEYTPSVFLSSNKSSPSSSSSSSVSSNKEDLAGAFEATGGAFFGLGGVVAANSTMQRY